MSDSDFSQIFSILFFYCNDKIDKFNNNARLIIEFDLRTMPPLLWWAYTRLLLSEKESPAGGGQKKEGQTRVWIPETSLEHHIWVQSDQ